MSTTSRTWTEDFRDRMHAWAEVARLRALIQEAPHTESCALRSERAWRRHGKTDACSCWKREALEGGK